jgi:hypothetical protein
MRTNGTLAHARVSGFIVTLLLFSCGDTPRNLVNPLLDAKMPKKIIWAWERPEDLRFLDAREYGVAFLAQTIFLEKENVTPSRRRQPLEINAGVYLIAVSRIETNKDTFLRPSFDGNMINRTASLVRETLSLPRVKAIQIDFDAAVSERSFYRVLMFEIKKQLPADTPLTMTALASWCASDTWFNDFPVDEAVPMVFVMGADSEKIRNFLKNGNDWNEPLCRGSYGLPVDEPAIEGLKTSRRIYYFSNAAWRSNDVL